MEEIEQFDNLLEDDALAPLKRNHACLQCKKRKVKCDAVGRCLNRLRQKADEIGKTHMFTMSAFPRSCRSGSYA